MMNRTTFSTANAAVLEDADLDQRVLGAQLEADEGRPAAAGRDDRADRRPGRSSPRCWPAAGRAPRGPCPPVISSGAAVVDRRRLLVLLGLRDGGQDQGDDRDGDVDPEDRAPGPLAEVAAGSGPTAVRPPAMPKKMPIALPRSRTGKAEITIASAAGNISAAPAPSSTRKKMIQASAMLALGGEPAGRRGDHEDDHADEHHRPVPDDVGQAAAEREQRRRATAGSR